MREHRVLVRMPAAPPAGCVIECCVQGRIVPLEYNVQRDDAGYLMYVDLPRINLEGFASI
jgi:hypothetical protein